MGYTIKLQAREKFERNFPSEFQKVMWKYLWGGRKNSFMGAKARSLVSQYD
jgi:hypothetical protein